METEQADMVEQPCWLRCKNWADPGHRRLHLLSEVIHAEEDRGRWDGVPEGWQKVRDVEVWSDGKDYLITGEPPDEEVELAHIEKTGDYRHNCDYMGCGMVHVVARGEYWGTAL